MLDERDERRFSLDEVEEISNVDLSNCDIGQLHNLLRRGKVTGKEMMGYYIKRCREVL